MCNKSPTQPPPVCRPAVLFVQADKPRELTAEERMRAALSDLCDRADRARNILSRDGEWNMLDTKEARAILRGES